jgi:hypothetical protein
VVALPPNGITALPAISLFSGSELTVSGSLTFDALKTFCQQHTTAPAAKVTVTAGGVFTGGCQQVP